MWNITPLDLGTLNVPRSNMLRHDSRDIRVDVPVIAWLLTECTTGRRLLVDTGACDDPDWGEKHHNPLRREREGQYLPTALREHGVDPASIDRILLTHLHWDHAYGVKHCPNARVIVQRRELLYAVDPTHRHANIYETTLDTKMPFFFEYFTRLEVIEGDREIEPGIHVVTLPGHSPGSQGIVVQAKNGRYLIAGDLVNVIENLTQRTPGSLFTNLPVCRRSFAKAAACADIVLPAHDYRAFSMVHDTCAAR